MSPGRYRRASSRTFNGKGNDMLNREHLERPLAAALAVLAVVMTIGPAWGGEESWPSEFRDTFTDAERREPYVQARSFTMYQWPFIDGQWEGITADERGRVWYSVSSHSPTEHAQVFMYDPKEDRVRHIADLGQAVGEKLIDTAPHDKIHARMYADGRYIYTATCDGGGKDTDYAGGYWIKIDTKTGRVIPLAKSKSNDGIIAMGYDRKRGLLYGHTNHKGRLLVYNLETGEERDLGYPYQDYEADWPRGIDLMVAPDGKVFGLRPPRCTIWQYDPETDEITVVDVDMPTPADVRGEKPKRTSGHEMPEERVREHWNTSAGHMSFWDEKLGCFWFLRGHDQMLMKFHPPTAEQEPRVEAVEPLGRGYSRYRNFPASCTLEMDEDRVIWYTPGTGWGGEAYLQSYNTETGEFRDYGPIVTDGGRRITESHAMALDGGRIYLVAFVFNKAGSEDPVRKWAGRGKWPFHARFLVIDPEVHARPGKAEAEAGNEPTAKAD